MNRILATCVPLLAVSVLPSCGRDGKSHGGSGLKEDFGCVAAAPAYADTVVQATGASGTGFGDSHRAVDGVRGAGRFMGGTDVFSLDKAQDGVLIVRWGQRVVCNKPGVDFNVFENGFIDRRSGSMFFEAMVVSVSLDGSSYEDFPHQYTGSQSPADAASAANWHGFAGMHPVFYNEDTNNSASGVDPLDESQAGGDAFDLDSLPDSPTGRAVKAQGFRYLKLTAAPKAGFPNVPSAYGGYADVDGVYADSFLAD
jgi:hypothetical protein